MNAYAWQMTFRKAGVPPLSPGRTPVKWTCVLMWHFTGTSGLAGAWRGARPPRVSTWWGSGHALPYVLPRSYPAAACAGFLKRLHVMPWTGLA